MKNQSFNFFTLSLIHECITIINFLNKLNTGFYKFISTHITPYLSSKRLTEDNQTQAVVFHNSETFIVTDEIIN